MFQDFSEDILVRGKFGGGNFALGKQVKRPSFFSVFPHVLPKNVEHWNKTFFCFVIKALQAFFCSTGLEQIGTRLGTKWKLCGGMVRCLSFRIKLNDAGLGLEEFHYTVER